MDHEQRTTKQKQHQLLALDAVFSALRAIPSFWVYPVGTLWGYGHVRLANGT